jgi:sec-independent protein translocase protein TatA
MSAHRTRTYPEGRVFAGSSGVDSDPLAREPARVRQAGIRRRSPGLLQPNPGVIKRTRFFSAMSPSPMQLLVIALIILLLFGASRLGEVGKGLGEGIRNFKKGVAGGDDDGEEKDKDAKRLKDKDGDDAKGADKKAEEKA